MCDDEDADEAFKSFKPDNIRNHITSAHSFSVKMQRKEKFEIRCFLTTTKDIGSQTSAEEENDELPETEIEADSEIHICTMCDKNDGEAFKSISASIVRRHAMEIHSYSLRMQKKYKSTIRCVLIPLNKPYLK